MLIRETGAKCGSSYVDQNFKRWLKALLGDNCYRKLDPSNQIEDRSGSVVEGGGMRALMKHFGQHKRRFRHDQRDICIDLPEPLENLSIEGRVVDGQITLTLYVCIWFGKAYQLLKFHRQDFKSFFDPLVDQTVELLQRQITGIERRKRRVKVSNSSATSAYNICSVILTRTSLRMFS
jgi:hypothetical protein